MKKIEKRQRRAYDVLHPRTATPGFTRSASAQWAVRKFVVAVLLQLAPVDPPDRGEFCTHPLGGRPRHDEQE